jgi:hypothetical protein
MPVDHFQRLVLEFKRLWVAACVERLERLKSLWEPWITRMLTEPMPEDWEAELDRFVEEVRHSCGLIVSVDSIGQIENLLRARAGGTGIFAAAGPAPVVRDAPARSNPAVRPGAVRRTNPNRPSTQPRTTPAPPTGGPPLQAPSSGGVAGATIPEEDRRYYTGDRGINAWLDDNYDFDALRERLVKNWWDNFFAAAAARTRQQYAQLNQTADLLVKAGLPQATADRILREAEGPFVMAPGTNFDPIAEARKKLWQAAAAIPQPKAAGGSGGNKPPDATMVSGAGGEDFPNKRGPKTDPDEPHNRKIREVAEQLEREGNKIVAAGGGRGEREKVVNTLGGLLNKRRPDIIYRTPSGELRAVNVGLAGKDGKPIEREQQALDDLNGPAGLPTTFVPYNK